MIKKLSISNFKSVRHLEVDCKKVNLFIGEPNTGKSNILEALALLSWCGHNSRSLNDYVRIRLMQNLFYDQLLDQGIEISVADGPRGDLYVRFADDRFEFHSRTDVHPFATVGYDGRCGSNTCFQFGEVKFFHFKAGNKFDDKEPGNLKPPDGSNLFSVVFGSQILRDTVKEFFTKYGLRLVMKPHERVFELQKQVDDLVFSVPYSLTSDTLRRIIFYTVAMASNKDSVLVFEEPESNAFPYYTKYLGERIALDETNQFFIATHNPYLLSAVVEKARKEDVQVFITYFQDYETRVKALTPDQLSELMESDPFFNLDRFIEEGQ